VSLVEGEEVQSDWQTDFFRGPALEFWRRAMSPEQTRSQADFLEKALQAPPRGRLLDVPCGNGRHAVELAGRGYWLTGIDSSEEFLAEARGATTLPSRWILGDMRELPGLVEPAAFDGAYCCGNSFGYLDADGARKFLAAVATALKPGGRFVMDTGMAAESILPTLGKGRWHRLGDMIVLSENQYHPAESRLDIDYTFIENGTVETRPSSSYCFTTGEICRMHAESGLEVVALQGWYDGQPYQLGPGGLIVISRKA
jgi:SAM-dependent methyltransferase